MQPGIEHKLADNSSQHFLAVVTLFPGHPVYASAATCNNQSSEGPIALHLLKIMLIVPGKQPSVCEAVHKEDLERHSECIVVTVHVQCAWRK